MKYVSRILFIGGFLFALFAIPLVTLLKPVEQISIYEQRTLATAPTFSGQGDIGNPVLSSYRYE